MKKEIQTTKDIGEFFRTARKKADMTIVQVAKKSGFTWHTIYNLEKNRGSVVVSTLLAVATSIGIKVEVNFEDQSNIKIKELK